MSAYVVVESSVRDAEARDRYAPLAKAGIESAGGEVLALGHWTVLASHPDFQNALLIRFDDKEAALAWYRSPYFQSLDDLRDVALETRFRLIS